jgi:GntR family transcriptional regulator
VGIHSEAFSRELILSQTDPRPMYLQILEQIRLRVAAGDLVPGDELPSIRQLAVALRVSVITVKRAYLELERAGVIVTQHGKGSRVAAAPQLDPARLELQLRELLAELWRVGARLGLTPEELAARLAAVAEETNSLADEEETR